LTKKKKANNSKGEEPVTDVWEYEEKPRVYILFWRSHLLAPTIIWLPAWTISLYLKV